MSNSSCNYSNAAGRNTKPAKQNRNTSRAGAGRKASIGNDNPSGDKDTSITCSCECESLSGNGHRTMDVRCSTSRGNFGCDTCCERGCANFHPRESISHLSKNIPFSGGRDLSNGGLKLR